jgi:hypothetical protein
LAHDCGVPMHKRTLIHSVRRNPAVQQRRCTPAELRGEIDCGSRRGSALPRMVLTEISDGVRSVAEADARAVLAKLRGAYQVASQRTRPPVTDIASKLMGAAPP